MTLSPARLPYGLLELTFSRAYGLTSNALKVGQLESPYGWKRCIHARSMHQVALAAVQQPPPPLPMDNIDTGVLAQDAGVGRRGRKMRRGLGLAKYKASAVGYELERRVQALDVAAVEEETSVNPPTYTESELMLFYEDLLTTSSKADLKVDIEVLERQRAEEDVRIVQEAEKRLLESYPDIPNQPVDGNNFNFADIEPRHRVLMRAQAIVAHLEDMRILAQGPSSSQNASALSNFVVPISVLSLQECEALVRVCTKAEDGSAALLALDIMKRSGMPIPETAVTEALEILASKGDVKAAEVLMANFISSPTERQRHLHVKSHLKATPRDQIPTSALAILHSYEEKSLAAPMQTYTSAIITLFSNPSSVARAQAWDLFSHMRYVAHPDPDVLLYSLMIRACASPLSSARRSEPERALDFWTEMTVEKRIEPTVGAYNAVILACARSGSKSYVDEAYRLAKEMLDSHRDARGISAFRPDRKTFCALLEGAKRIGDLRRARWILAEMVRADPHDPNGPVDVMVNEEVMMHLFQAYAIYRPPFKREATRVVQEARESAKDMKTGRSSHEQDTSGQIPPDPSGPTAIALDSPPSFSHIPPQTHDEVLHEVNFLFQRILNDTGILKIPDAQSDISPNIVNKFYNVTLTPRLLSSYISVFFRHASLDVARKMFWRVFNDLHVPRTARVYVEALERCAFSPKGYDREVAIEFMEELWRDWETIEDSGMDGERRLGARLIERAHTAKIRLCALTDDVERALHYVHVFVQRYPPVFVRMHTPKPALRSTRTALVGPRPLVRMTTTLDVPDDSVPPLLTFDDLEVLHHRLMMFEMHKEIGYVKWVTKSYEWMLRVRRDEGFKSTAMATL